MHSNCAREANVSKPSRLENRRSATHLVAVPILDHPVLPNAPEQMTAPLKRNLHDRLVVREERAVAVSEIEAPDLDVLVGGAGDDQFRVGRDVEREDGELRAPGRVSRSSAKGRGQPERTL